jgi:ABC-type lipoprotein export system ATPase subunit
MTLPVSDEQIKNFLALFSGDILAAQSALQRYKDKARVENERLNRQSRGETIISLEDVSKKYPVGKRMVKALSDVSLAIDKGEFVAITGASGSGKSTLLHIIGCLDTPTTGQITVDGKDTTRLSDNDLSELRKNTIGFIFQSFYLQPFLRVRDNLAVPAMFANASKKDMEKKVAVLLEQVGLLERAAHFPKELSGGQIQRAAIARALVNNPKVILADEPTGNLDSVNSQAIIDLFQSIREKIGTTIIVVTHDAHIARQADRVIELKDGRVL